jgi:putative two-component system response regulator
MEPKEITIMIVDDVATNLKCAKDALRPLGDVVTSLSAVRMFELLPVIKPQLILLDVNMPEMDGLTALKRLKSTPELSEIPVIFLTSNAAPFSEIEGLSLGAVDYITKPFEPALLTKRVEIHLTIERQKRTMAAQSRQLKDFNDNLQKMVKEETRKVFTLQGALLDAVVDLVEGRDDVTGSHVSRTMRWLEILLDGMAEFGFCPPWPEDWDSRLILQSSRLHDVGKIAVADAILRKPGQLTLDEFEAIKLHPVVGAQIIDKISLSLPAEEHLFLNHARVLALTHHEKWDGTGYPLGLSGRSIPLQGRLMAISDVYDALVSRRPYKEAFPHERAVEIIVGGRGRQFDPDLVDIFEKVSHRFIA